MVDSNQELLQSEVAAKKRKESPGKAAGGGHGTKSPAAPKGETLTKLKRFLKGAWSELKKVHWPNRREIITFTIVVLSAVLIVAVMIFVVDSILSKVLEFIIPK